MQKLPAIVRMTRMERQIRIWLLFVMVSSIALYMAGDLPWLFLNRMTINAFKMIGQALFILTLVLAIVQRLTFKHRLNSTRHAISQLSPDAYERLVQRAESNMAEKNRIPESFQTPALTRLYTQRPKLFYATMLPLVCSTLGLILYIVVSHQFGPEATRDVERFFWSKSWGFFSLAPVLIVLSIPGGLLLFTYGMGISPRLSRRDAEEHYKILKTNHSGQSLGGLSVAQEVEDGRLSVASDEREGEPIGPSAR